MGNKKKARNNGNNHHRSMQRRWSAQKYVRKKMAKTSHQGSDSEHLHGSRIINLEKLQEFIDQLTSHSKQCGSQIILSGERREGLASIISSRCSKYSFSIPLTTSPKVRGPKGTSQWEANLAAVLGHMATGGGHTRLQETMSTLGIPFMSPKNFINTEQGIGEWWQLQLQAEMEEAGKEEKRLAVERAVYHQGVPALTVIVDVAWSKRSHKHSYNAKSGVGVIIGKATGRLLFIGVRNKYCTACTQGVPQKNTNASRIGTNCLRKWRLILY